METSEKIDLWCRDVEIRQVLLHGSCIDVTLEAWRGQKTLQFRTKKKLSECVSIIEGFHPDTVARYQQSTALDVPESDGEHPAQPVEKAVAQFLVEMCDHFRVAPTGESMTLGFEFLPQSLVVVDLSVEDNPDRFIFVRHGLVDSFDIDNAQSAHPKACQLVAVVALFIRASVDERLRHSAKQLVVLPSVETSYSTHRPLTIRLGMLAPIEALPVRGMRDPPVLNRRVNRVLSASQAASD